MNPTSVLSPEIVDLGLAIGLLHQSGSSVEFDSDWFSTPGPKVATALADDQRRAALVRFVDAVSGRAPPGNPGGVTLVKLFDATELGLAGAPALTVSLSLDDRDAVYVEVGVAVSYATTSPVTRTNLVVPLYRTGRLAGTTVQPVGEHFALAAGAPIRLATSIALGDGVPDGSGFGLRSVDVTVGVPCTGLSPTVEISLVGLRLPGSTAPVDIHIGGPDSTIEDALLSLVLGVVKAGASALGPTGETMLAALDLLGLGPDATLPPLDLGALADQGVGALRTWFATTLADDSRRLAWLDSLRTVIGGTLDGGELRVALGGGPVQLTIGVTAVPGPGGHLRVTPRVGLELATLLGGGATGVRLAAQAVVDVVTVDLADGSLTPVPGAELFVDITGDAARLLASGPVQIGSAHLGVGLVGGSVVPVIRLHDVLAGGSTHAVVDLSSADAVVAAAGHVAGDLARTALDGFAAGAHLKALLGLVSMGATLPLDAAQLFVDPLGALGGWWHLLVSAHPADVPEVLGHLRDLIAHDSKVALPANGGIAAPVSGAGTIDSPWSVPIVDRVSLDLWLDGTVLVVALSLGFRVDDLAGGCTVVEVSARAELAAIDLVGRHASLLRAVDLTAALRGRGVPQTRLDLGPVAIVADSIGVVVRWAAVAGLEVQLRTPGLAAEVDGGVVPLALPIGGEWRTSALDDIEHLVGVLGASNPYGWLHDLVDLLGWTITGRGQPHRLALSGLAADPGPALRDWMAALLTDEDVLGRISTTLARVLTGSTGGLVGAISGRGTPTDPWVLPLGRTAAGPALTFSFGPHGPRLAPSMTSTMLQGWRPSLPGLPPAGLARSILDEAGAGEDIAALVRGRGDLASGFGDLALRVLNTDVLVAPPPAALDGVDVQVHPGATFAGWATWAVTDALGAPPDATAAVVHVAVATPAGSPWPAAPADRVLDLSAPALPPESFTVAAPAAGEWFVLLGRRADCSLGTSDPSGVLGQAARLGRIIAALGTGRSVVVLALGGAGHAARVAADAQSAVTNLVTLGTPWSPVAFDTARNGASASTLRLLQVLLPAPDPAEPDDTDLALGRAIVDGLLDTATQFELEAPRPPTTVRAGLAVRAWFGGLERAAVDRAFTAVVAAGLGQRARARAATNGAPATSVAVSLRIPIDVGSPPAGHGIVVGGHVELGLLASDFVARSIGVDGRVRAHLTIADSDSWLIGGPGTTPGDGAPALELRWIEATVDRGLGAGAVSRATLTLHEVAALGASRDQLVVRPNVSATGTIEDSPFLPEARAVVAALITKLRGEATGSAAAAVVGLLDGIGLSTAAGLVPDALSHLLHDPAAFLGPVLAGLQGAGALADALVALVPGATRSGQTVAITTGPATFSIDLATRRVGVSAASTVGALPWRLDLAGIGGAAPTGSVTIGSPAFNGAGVRFGLAPFTATLVRETAAGTPSSVALWPNPDTDGVVAFAQAALPAEAIRLVLDGVRGLDTTLAGQIDALAGAIGMLGAADANGVRPLIAAVALFDDPGGWFRHHVFGVAPAEQLDRVVDLFEGLKPFVGLAGTPRGTWPVAAGVTLQVTGGGTGASIAIALDAGAWLGGAGRVPFAAGVVLGLTVSANGAPRPAVELFVGLAETTPSAEHRRSVHVLLDPTGLRALLRPTTGADIPLFPGAAGLGALLEAASVDLLLPMVLDQLARLTGSPARDQVAALTGALGIGLDLVALPITTPVTFDGAKLHDLADHPATRLATQATALLTRAVGALHPLLQQLPGAPSAVLSGANLVVAVRGTTLTITPSPLRIAVSGSVGGIPVVGGASAAFTADARGLRSWSFGIGPAVFDLDGPRLRPLLRGGREEGAGWEVGVGLSLDDLGAGAAGHKELFGRWRESDGLAIVARTHDTTADHDVTDPATVATFAADAVLELLGNYVIAQPDLVTLLDKSVGGTTVRALLQGSILADVDDHKLRAGPVSSLPGSLFVLARQLAGALPPLSLGPDDALELALAETAGVIGLRLNVKDPNTGLALNQGGDTVISLVSDSSWIAPPSGGAPPAGIVVGIVSISSDPIPVVVVRPGIAANGIGVRVAKSSGPLLDAGLRLDAVAVHLFGSLQPNGAGGVDVSGGVHLELDGLAVPLGSGGGTNAVAQGVMNDAAGSGSPPTPKFSPAISVQSHHGGNGVAVSLSAGAGDGPWYLPIRRAFGPVYLEQIGLGTGYVGTAPRSLDWISMSLDGSVSLFGITASVDKLRLTYHAHRPFFDVKSWEVDLDGFAIASSIGGLTLAGALIRAPLAAPLQGVEYLGMLKIGFSGYGLDLFGGYAHPTDGNGSFASFFAFGALHAPLGGVPAFFITGIGLGLGINRELKPPNMDTITRNPFLVAMKALGPAPDPKAELEQMRASMAPKRGEYWVAAGISFTSFVLISGEIVLTIAFGDGLEITLLGLARAELPVPGAALVSIELALMARFSSTEGVVIVQAQLTENSWLLMPSVRLTGGFAFATWWKGPNAGQFVVTMGGYHPSFDHPGYPTVPRLGLRWQPIENISIIGESYFALCSEAIMAGISIEVSAHFGPAHARLSIGADGIVFFDPFFFRVSAWAEISAGIRIWVLFGTIDIELNFGAAVEISGPPIHVSGHFSICGFEVPFEFGEEANPADSALSAVQFRDKYLRASSDAQVIQASIVTGSLTAGKNTDGSPRKVPDGSVANPFLLTPEFEMVVVSTAPAVDMALRHEGEADKTMRVAAPELGVAPMYSHTLTSDLHVALSKVGAPANALSIAAVTVAPRTRAAFPKGVWGEAPVVNAPKVPAGETIAASDGFTISTVLADPAGAVAIDYHQVELPFGGRKPLPFVTNRALTDSRLVAASELKALADSFRPAATDRNGRFDVAARLLGAGGYGAVGVAALRGERAAVPLFGSLADDMVAAPVAVSTVVAATVVDRTRPAPVFVAPIFKAVLGGPLTLAASGSPHTHVAQPGAAVPVAVPSIDGVRGPISTVAPASLLVQARRATVVGRTLGATAAVPVTRLATSTVGGVVNASPDRAAAERLASMSNSLPNGAALHDGEVAVLAVASRPAIDSEVPDRLVISGGTTRVIALAAGGNVLFDDVVAPAADGLPATVDVPWKTERVVLVGLGALAGIGGSLDGWYTGQSLPSVGWGIAIAASAVVTFANNKVTATRERNDGGWANTRELARASQVVTRFDNPVTAIAIAVDDDTPGAAAADAVQMRLVGASRATDANGAVVPPVLLVQGVRTVLLYAIAPAPLTGVVRADTVDPCILVIVDGARDAHLGGVAAGVGTIDELAATITSYGFDAAIANPLPGGSGTRSIAWASATREG